MDRIHNLLKAYFQGTISQEEKTILDEWLESSVENRLLFRELNDPDKMSELLQKMDGYDEETIWNQIESKRNKKTILFPAHWFRYAAAASLALLLSFGAYFIIHRNPEKPTITAIVYKGDVQPGHNGAVLHLSNGKSIVLDSAADGTIATQGNIKAIKINGALKYTGLADGVVVYNTVTTDRGRQWQITLPDGTKVWLNAASSIHYPLNFSGPEREVEITGEVYFEVKHNVKQPFRVKAGNQSIEDIGTAFNVNAYQEEQTVKTTLVEGAVKVNGTNLHPGQQATLTNNQIKVNAANIEQTLAWKNGLFSFDKADIYTVMRQLSRWYNVEVEYEGKPDNTPFQGEIGRSLTLAQVLKVLETVHVHFRIEEDKRIVIMH